MKRVFKKGLRFFARAKKALAYSLAALAFTAGCSGGDGGAAAPAAAPEKPAGPEKTAEAAPPPAPLRKVYVRYEENPEFIAGFKALKAERSREVLRALSLKRERAVEIFEQARSALPAGAPGADIYKELEGNPEKYPEWAGLVKELDALNAKNREYAKRFQEYVGEYQRRNKADLTDLREGRATAIETNPAETGRLWGARID